MLKPMTSSLFDAVQIRPAIETGICNFANGANRRQSATHPSEDAFTEPVVCQKRTGS